MRRVMLPGLGAETSCLGFGCASLGSRVSAAQGTRALAAAYEGGVRWFDTAPAYGAGESERILGRFVAERSDTVQICTKVGLLPPKQSLVKNTLRTVLRPAVKFAKPLRRMIRKTGATTNRSINLTPELLRGSLERSLTRLGTDYVDVYALHNAQESDLARDEILAMLEALIAEGKTRTVAVAGSTEVAYAAVKTGTPFGIVQFGQPESDSTGAAVLDAAAVAGIGCVTHSVFGVAGQLQQAAAALRADSALSALLAEAGYAGAPAAAAAALLLDRAYVANPQGVVLVSMMSKRFRTTNLTAASRAANPRVLALCAEMGL